MKKRERTQEEANNTRGEACKNEGRIVQIRTKKRKEKRKGNKTRRKEEKKETKR